MKTHKFSLVILFNLAFGGCAHYQPAGSDAEPPVSRFEQNRQATVLIINKFENGAALGTGVVVDKRGLILTNHHVIESQFDDQTRQAIPGKPMVCEVKGIALACVPAVVVASTEKQDAALLRVERSYPYEVEIIDDRGVTEAENIYMRGSVGPLLPPALMVGNFIGRADPRYEFAPFKVPILVLDLAIQSGCSGGPVFDSDGRMIGLVKAIIHFSGRPLGLAVPGSVIKSFVETYDPFSDGTKKK